MADVSDVKGTGLSCYRVSTSKHPNKRKKIEHMTNW